MNEFSQPESEANHHNQQSDSARPPEPGFKKVRAAVREGAEAARAAAREALPRLKSAVGEADYWAAYGVSYAAVFSWTVLKSVTPQEFKSGAAEGSKAGATAAASWVDKLTKTRAESAVQPPLLPAPGEGAEPSLA